MDEVMIECAKLSMQHKLTLNIRWILPHWVVAYFVDMSGQSVSQLCQGHIDHSETGDPLLDALQILVDTTRKAYETIV